MMRRKRKHIIFALTAISQNFISCCVASRCKRVEDINPPTCNIDDLSDGVLAKICKKAGLPMQPNLTRDKRVSAAKLCYQFSSGNGNTDDIDDLNDEELIDICERIKFPIPQNPTREQLVISARMCRKLATKDGTKSVISSIVNSLGIGSNNIDYNGKVGKCGTEDNSAEYVSCLESDAIRLHFEYLTRMVDDPTFISKNKHDRISYLLSKYNIDDVPEEEKVMRQLVETLIEKKESTKTAVVDTTASRCEQVEDLESPSCNMEILLGSEKHKLEHLSDEELRSICARVGSNWSKSMDLTREELLQSATTCHNMIKISKPALDELYLAYLTMMEDKSLVSKYRFRHDRVIYLLSKQQSMSNDEKKLLAHMLFNKLGEEGEESLAADTNFYSHEVWSSERPGTYMPTPEEIAKLPQWEYVSKRRDMFKKLRFGNDWHMEIFQENGKAILAIGEDFNMHHKDIQDMYENEGIEGWDINDFVRKLGQYDHVFPLVLGRGFLLQGSEQNLLAGCNRGDDPLVVAQNVIDEYDLEESNLEFIARVVEVHLGVFDLPIPILTLDDHEPDSVANVPTEAYQILLFFVIAMIGFICLLSYEYVSQRKKSPKKVRKQSRVSPLSCHQPKIKKTVYVKLFASKNLNGKQGRRLNGIITKSGVDNIEFERKTGQPTVMYKIKASNGVVYVPVHIKGSEEAVEKAISLIQEATGKDNVDEKIELPPTNTKQAATSTSKISASAPLKIPKKKKSTDRSLLSSIWLTACASCQSLRTMTINTCKSAINYIGKGTVITVAVLYLVLYCMVYWKVDCKLLQHDMTNYYFHCDSELFCSNDTADIVCHKMSEAAFVASVAFMWLVICSVVVLVLRTIAYGFSLMLKYDARMAKSLIIIFGILCCMTCLVLRWTCGDIERHSIEHLRYRAAFEDAIFEVSVCQPVQNYILILLPVLLFLSGMILLILRGVAFGISLVNKYTGMLRMPFDLYQAKKITQTIYIKANQSKNLSGKKGRKKKEIISKSGVDDIQIDTSAVGDNYVEVYLKGSIRSVWEAIDLIEEAVGTEYVSVNKPSSLIPALMIPQPQTGFMLYDTNPVREPTAGHMDDRSNNLAEEVAEVETSPVKVVREEDVPSEIGIDSTQGMTQETITEASISSLNNRSSISRTHSSFTLNENDPLLIFLRSQQSCIKGSVDEFYTWLVKSEDIDSMIALKEAVNEDDYLNDMKVGDGGSGVKGFKRKAFLRAISEYFNDESDTKSTEDHSLPQCQKKNLSETLEPPEELVCPISLVLMTNEPVLAADGIMYERAPIEDWFQKSKAKICRAQENLKQNPQSEADQRVIKNGVCSPVQGTKMDNLTLRPLIGTRNMARSFEAKQKKSEG